MKLSKDQSYLATIKRNHRISTNVERQKGDDKIDEKWRHLKALKHIRRLSGIPLLQPYNVAIHCYYTGLLFEEVAEHEDIRISLIEVDFVYRHDILESITGDVLLPVKMHSETTGRKWKEIEQELVSSKYDYLTWYTDENAKIYFNPLTWSLFKACDLYELYLFCLEEVRLGNNSDGINLVIENCIKLLPEFKINYITERLK